jgi:cellulase/cellobiase CelA1
LVTNSNLTTCQQSADGYRQGVAYALQQLNLPNVVMYLDAGHGGWLGEFKSSVLDSEIDQQSLSGWDANLSTQPLITYTLLNK